MIDVAEPQLESAELVALIDRLEQLLIRSEIEEIEIEAGGTGLVLRTPAAVATQAVVAGGAVETRPPAEAQEAEEAPRTHAVLAPLTGLFYSSPSPGAEPYLREGAEIHVGQVIGLIEAMKLFNEIKSDAAGRVARICVESGALVKAKQPLIEVEPA
jgi:acetyl-CoA carboxylase biotin carboxyl carrier protein